MSGRPTSEVEFDASLVPPRFDLTSSCLRARPIQGNIKADTAMNTINIFEGRLLRLQEEYDLVCRAKDVSRVSLFPFGL